MNDVLSRNASTELNPHPAGFAQGRSSTLTRMEAALLEYLQNHSKRPVSRGELLAEVWHLDPSRVLTRTVEMHVAKLRKKLGDDPREPRWLITVPRQGYQFRL